MANIDLSQTICLKNKSEANPDEKFLKVPKDVYLRMLDKLFEEGYPPTIEIAVGGIEYSDLIVQLNYYENEEYSFDTSDYGCYTEDPCPGFLEDICIIGCLVIEETPDPELGCTWYASNLDTIVCDSGQPRCEGQFAIVSGSSAVSATLESNLIRDEEKCLTLKGQGAEPFDLVSAPDDIPPACEGLPVLQAESYKGDVTIGNYYDFSSVYADADTIKDAQNIYLKCITVKVYINLVWGGHIGEEISECCGGWRWTAAASGAGTVDIFLGGDKDDPDYVEIGTTTLLGEEISIGYYKIDGEGPALKINDFSVTIAPGVK